MLGEQVKSIGLSMGTIFWPIFVHLHSHSSAHQNDTMQRVYNLKEPTDLLVATETFWDTTYLCLPGST